MTTSPLTRIATFATFFAAAVATAPAALAQSDGSALSRAEVNQQTRAAIAAGHMLPAGELIAVDAPVSTASRAERKAETLAVNRTGKLGDYGRNTWYTYNVVPRLALDTSTKTRAERKAETMQAIQHKQMVPAGEAI